MNLGPDQTLLHYRLIEQIGEGGMGVVWRAVDTTLDREVAIKVLPEAFALDTERLARFEREAKVLASLNHPNIAAVYSVHQVETLRFLAMELVRGEDLAARLTRGRLAPNDALLLASQIAEALETAHSSGVIHRDLKPANVQVTEDGQAKVLDFGLSKAAEPKAGGASDLSMSPTVTSLGTVAGVILGTAAYMSPEQARGKVVDNRADVWAFGCLLYEMLSGSRPFEGETTTDMLGAIMHREPDWGALPAEVPPAIRRLLKRCLRRDQRQRLRHIGDARIVVDDVLAGDVEESTGGRSPDARPSRRSRLVPVAAVLIGAALGAVAVWTARPQPATGLPLRKSEILLGHGDLTDSVAVRPVLSPDGSHLVYAGQDGLHVRDLSQIENRAIPATEGARNPFWSPDGQWIGFARGVNIEKVPLAGGTPTQIAVLADDLGASGSGSWSADGKITLSTGTTGLLQVSAQGGEASVLVELEEGESDYHEHVLLPDGKGWLFVVHRSQAGFDTLAVATPDGQRHALVTFAGENLTDPAYSPTGHILVRRLGSIRGIWALPFSVDTMQMTGEPFLVAQHGTSPSIGGDGSLAYVRNPLERRSRLNWVDRSGKVIAPLGEPLGMLYPFPLLSADDGRLLVTGGSTESREVWVYDAKTGNRRQITFDGLRRDMATWHPDENQIFSYAVNDMTIHRESIDGSQPAADLGSGIMPVVTRDASTLIYARQKPQNWDFDIVMRPIDADPGSAELLVDGTGIQWFPILSPDEEFMLYTSNETGRDEVYVTTFPEPGNRWRVSTEGGSFARWRGDGREIFFARDDGIYAVGINPDTGMPTSQPRLLFRRTTTRWNQTWPDGFDVTADGQRFVVAENVIADDSAPPSIVVTQNWIAEFR